MTKRVQFRRGTTAQHAAFAGVIGEITVDTDKETIVVGNGSLGGVPAARADRPRGWTKTEFFTANSIWTQTGKTDLKRIIVTAYGGGNSGGTNSGGGAGGIGLVTLEASAVTTNVSVTIGAAGGGTTSFGAYIQCTGGTAGSGSTAGVGGTASGTGVFSLGGASGQNGLGSNVTSASGGGFGGGQAGTAAKGIFGSGGGSGAAGSAGCVIVQEIYGYV